MVSAGEIGKKKTLIGLGLGQFLSILITSTGFSSSELARKGKMVLLYTSWTSRCTGKFSCCFTNQSRLYESLLILIASAVVKAYQYTSITSVMLLDCWSIPSVMLLTWLFLKTKYRYRKITGVLACVVGLVMVVFSDVHRNDRSGGSNPRLGDILVTAGSILYAITNVSEEFLVKNADRVELMGMLGLFGAVISAIQISIFERGELKSINWTAGAALPFAGFAVAMFLFYSLVPILLKINGSTMLNLSLLTSDMWAVLIRVFAYHEKVDWMYFVAFAAVAVGLIIYSVGDKEEDQNLANEGPERSKHLVEEAERTREHTRSGF